MNKQDQNPNRNNYDIQQFPYNPESFKTFVQILLRLFHDPPAIVIGDCLIREQKSFTDKDLAVKLNLSDRQVRESLRQLEEDLVVIRDNKLSDVFSQGSSSSSDQVSSGKGHSGPASSSHADQLESKYPVNQGAGGGPGSSSSGYSSSIGLPSNKVGPSFYRINPHLPAVVEWQYKTIIREIDQEIKDAVNLDELVCHQCNAKYSSLEALSLDLNPEDGLFLCRFCNEKLKSVDSASFRNAAKDKAERVRSQLQVLSNSLELVKNMQVPIFPPYQSKNDTSTNKTKLLSNSESNGDTSRKIPDDQDLKNNSSSYEASTPKSQDNISSSSPHSSQSKININMNNQAPSIMKNLSSSQTLPQHTVSKVKFGIKLSTKSTNFSLLGASNNHHSKFARGNPSFNFNINTKREPPSSDVHSSAKTKDSTDSSNITAKTDDGGSCSNGLGPEEQSPPSHQASPKPPTKIEEPTFSVSAIRDKIFKITEIDDDIINQMTDNEYLKYDELLQKYQTLGLINT